MFKTGELTMSNLPMDSNGIHQLWGMSDRSSSEKRIIQEVMYDHAPKHDFKKQVELHEKIRNDDDYDDWNYGTDAVYGISWK